MVLHLEAFGWTKAMMQADVFNKKPFRKKTLKNLVLYLVVSSNGENFIPKCVIFTLSG